MRTKNLKDERKKKKVKNKHGLIGCSHRSYQTKEWRGLRYTKIKQISTTVVFSPNTHDNIFLIQKTINEIKKFPNKTILYQLACLSHRYIQWVMKPSSGSPLYMNFLRVPSPYTCKIKKCSAHVRTITKAKSAEYQIPW